MYQIYFILEWHSTYCTPRRNISYPLASRQQYLFDICLLLYVQSWTPDDGRKDHPKHVECHSKMKEILYVGASCWFYYRNNGRTPLWLFVLSLFVDWSKPNSDHVYLGCPVSWHMYLYICQDTGHYKRNRNFQRYVASPDLTPCDFFLWGISKTEFSFLHFR